MALLNRPQHPHNLIHSRCRSCSPTLSSLSPSLIHNNKCNPNNKPSSSSLKASVKTVNNRHPTKHPKQHKTQISPQRTMAPHFQYSPTTLVHRLACKSHNKACNSKTRNPPTTKTNTYLIKMSRFPTHPFRAAGSHTNPHPPRHNTKALSGIRI